MNTASPTHFDRHYQSHLKHLKLKGLRPKTIEAYSRAIRRIGDYFDHQIGHLTEAQLTDYFCDLVATHSWSTVKLDLYPPRHSEQHAQQVQDKARLLRYGTSACVKPLR